MSISDNMVKMAKDLSDYIIKMRRDFHMYPELGYEEERTSGIVVDELNKLGYTIYRGAKTGVIGVLKGGDSVVALRADMDALPIQEKNDIPYKSRVPNKMHACGHDAHTAMLLGAAHIISKYSEEIPGTVKLIFQPAEEHGMGAKKIVEEGFVDDVDAIFGIHVWSDLESGVIGIREGPFLASSDSFKIMLKGLGGHGASPHLSKDPIVVAVDLINAYQKIISREVNPLEPAVLSVTSIHAGSTYNVIPEDAEMLGTIRTFNMDVRNLIVERMKEITLKYSEAMRCNASIEFAEDYLPPTINNSELAEFARDALRDLGKITVPEPTMGAEDFACYMEKTKGLFIALGIYNEEKGITYNHHHPKFNVDEDILWMGSAIHSILAYKYLKMKV